MICTPEAARLRHLLANARLRVLTEAEAAGVRNIAVVGSVARGDAGAGSDIDLLVDVDDDVSLFELVELRKCLGHLLGISIDLIERAGVSIGLEHLESEAIAL
jgi:predicted nucleotidyltransferase